MEKLSANELVNLIKSVFPHHSQDHAIGILVDIPRNPKDDHSNWKLRRSLAEEWYRLLKDHLVSLKVQKIMLIAYPDVGSNNADLPTYGTLIKKRLPVTADELNLYGNKISFEDIFKEAQIFLAPTQYSTTAPLKNAAKEFGFRAATMPGFSPEMIPALRIDYTEVNRRVLLIKEKLDRAEAAEVEFSVDGLDSFRMFFDLRFRKAHASTGRFPDKGQAGNLPSGEAYIVPYEGELQEKSKTEGMLPVQINDDVVLFRIKENRAVSARGEGQSAQVEAEHLRREPAYGNMAELGFGVLEDFGIQPIGKLLLDEKLGFHVAFGRSEHFGGIVGPNDFSTPGEVTHLDRIYIPSTQPRIAVRSIVLVYPKNQSETIIENSKYLIF